MYSVKINPLFVEISEYKHKADIPKNKDRKRDYKFESAMRSKKMIIDYALNNEWTHFITITLDKKKIDRTDFQMAIKKLTKYFKNWTYLKEKDFRYLIVPEEHKKIESNGKRAVHFHGFIYTKKMTMLNHKQKGQAHIYNCKEITERFGRNEFTVIYNTQEFIAYYISKYISKSFKDIKISNRKYFKSQKLKTSDIVRYDDLEGFKDFGLKESYENTFCKKWKFSNDEWKYIKNFLTFKECEKIEKNTCYFELSKTDRLIEIDLKGGKNKHVQYKFGNSIESSCKDSI